MDQEDAKAFQLRSQIRTVIWDFVTTFGPYEGTEICLTHFHEVLDEVRQEVADG